MKEAFIQSPLFTFEKRHVSKTKDRKLPDIQRVLRRYSLNTRAGTPTLIYRRGWYFHWCKTFGRFHASCRGEWSKNASIYTKKKISVSIYLRRLVFTRLVDGSFLFGNKRRIAS